MAQKTTTETAVEEKKKEGFWSTKITSVSFAPLFDHGPCPDHCNGFRKITDEYDWPNRCFGHFR